MTILILISDISGGHTHSPYFPFPFLLAFTFPFPSSSLLVGFHAKPIDKIEFQVADLGILQRRLVAICIIVPVLSFSDQSLIHQPGHLQFTVYTDFMSHRTAAILKVFGFLLLGNYTSKSHM